MTSDPLDDQVRRAVGQVPVPAGLEDRIRRSATRRRLLRWAAGAAAAAALVLLWPRPPVPTGSGPVFSLREPAPRALDLNPVSFTGDVRSTPEGFSIRFAKGGPRDE